MHRCRARKKVHVDKLKGAPFWRDGTTQVVPGEVAEEEWKKLAIVSLQTDIQAT